MARRDPGSHAAGVSDAVLRELERWWRQTGSVEHEAAWLQERARAGELAPERLQLAAYLGHSAAVVAAATPPQRIQSSHDLAAFARGLEPFGREAQVRVALAAVERLPPSPATKRTYLQACVSAVRRWLLEPGQDQARAAFWAGQQVADYCGPELNAYRLLGWTPGGIEAAASLLGWPPEARDEPLGACLAECWRVLGLEALNAVRAELVPWALGLDAHRI